MEELLELPDKHAAFAIFRNSCSSSRMAYLSCTTPRDLIAGYLKEFDALSKTTFEAISNIAVTERQWLQAKLSPSKTGLGMRSLYEHADASYVASCSQTHDSCTAIVNSHIWEAEDEASPLNKAMKRLNEEHGMGLAYDTPQPIRQQTMSAQIDAITYRQLVDRARDNYDKAHLKAQKRIELHGYVLCPVKLSTYTFPTGI